MGIPRVSESRLGLSCSYREEYDEYLPPLYIFITHKTLCFLLIKYHCIKHIYTSKYPDFTCKNIEPTQYSVKQTNFLNLLGSVLSSSDVIANEVDFVSVKSKFLKSVDHQMHCSCLSPQAKPCLFSEKPKKEYYAILS